jgi:Arc/MetJ family transcription regulator
MNGIAFKIYQERSLVDLHYKLERSPPSQPDDRILHKQISKPTMKTDFFIDEKLIDEAIQVTGLKTKQEVIELGLKTLIKLKQQEKIKAYRGNLQWEGNLDENRTNS